MVVSITVFFSLFFSFPLLLSSPQGILIYTSLPSVSHLFSRLFSVLFSPFCFLSFPLFPLFSCFFFVFEGNVASHPRSYPQPSFHLFSSVFERKFASHPRSYPQLSFRLFSFVFFVFEGKFASHPRSYPQPLFLSLFLFLMCFWEENLLRTPGRDHNRVLLSFLLFV